MIFFLYFFSFSQMNVLKILINPEMIVESHKFILFFFISQPETCFLLYVDFFSSIRFLLRVLCCVHTVNNDTFLYNVYKRSFRYFFSGCCGIFFFIFFICVLFDRWYIQKVNSRTIKNRI